MRNLQNESPKDDYRFIDHWVKCVSSDEKPPEVNSPKRTWDYKPLPEPRQISTLEAVVNGVTDGIKRAIRDCLIGSVILGGGIWIVVKIIGLFS